MLNQFEEAFLDVVLGCVIVLAIVLISAIGAVAIGGSARLPYGVLVGLFVWGIAGWSLAKRRARLNAEEQRRIHA